METRQTPPPAPMQEGGGMPKFPQKKSKKKLWLWIAIGFVAIFIILPAIFSDSADEKAADKNKAEEKEQVAEKSKPTGDPEKAKSMANLFTEDKDEFQKLSWIKPKSKPRYRSQTGVYTYFAMQDSVPQNFRMVIQYGADDWLFIKSYTFLIDGKTYDFIPDEVKRDNDSRIWEWSDTYVADSPELIVILAKIKESKGDVKIRFNGDTYHRDYTLTKNDINSLIQPLEYYEALGGE